MGKRDLPSREAVERWLVNHQHDRVLARYADIDRGAKLKCLFSEYAYPVWDKREDHKFRAEFYKKVVTGQTMKAMAPFRPLFRKQFEQLERVDSLMEYLPMVVDLYELSVELDRRIAEFLRENCGSAEELNETTYRAAFRECSTAEERRRQTDMVLDLAGFAKRTIESGGFIDALVRNFPTIPIFKRTALVRGANEMIRMARTAYNAAKSYRAELSEFIEIIREREYAFIDSMMGRDE
ncbi:MAG: hypothetical protein ABIH66_13330 [bacterium]